MKKTTFVILVLSIYFTSCATAQKTNRTSDEENLDNLKRALEGMGKAVTSEQVIPEKYMTTTSHIKQLASWIIWNTEKKAKVAVVDFPLLNNRITEYGRYFSDQLSTEIFLTSQGKITVVERTLLNSIIEEQNLWQSGIMHPSSLNKLKKLLGADYVVVGTLLVTKEQVRIRNTETYGEFCEFNLRILNTESGAIEHADKEKVWLSPNERKMIRKYIR